MMRTPCHYNRRKVGSNFDTCKMVLNPVAKFLAVTLSCAALSLALAACSSNGWLVLQDGAGNDTGRIGLFRRCTEDENCCSPGAWEGGRQLGGCGKGKARPPGVATVRPCVAPRTALCCPTTIQ